MSPQGSPIRELKPLTGVGGSCDTFSAVLFCLSFAPVRTVLYTNVRPAVKPEEMYYTSSYFKKLSPLFLNNNGKCSHANSSDL